MVTVKAIVDTEARVMEVMMRVRNQEEQRKEKHARWKALNWFARAGWLDRCRRVRREKGEQRDQTIGVTRVACPSCFWPMTNL